MFAGVASLGPLLVVDVRVVWCKESTTLFREGGLRLDARHCVKDCLHVSNHICNVRSIDVRCTAAGRCRGNFWLCFRTLRRGRMHRAVRRASRSTAAGAATTATRRRWRHVKVATMETMVYNNLGSNQLTTTSLQSNEDWAETQVKKAPGQAPATHDMRKCTYKQAKRRGGRPSGKQQCAPGLAPAASLSGISVAPGLAPAQRLARDRRRRGLPQRAMWQESVWRRGLPQRIGVGQESGG